MLMVFTLFIGQWLVICSDHALLPNLISPFPDESARIMRVVFYDLTGKLEYVK